MTHEEIDFVIDTLETSIEWAEYADEYFQKKHGLAQDKENVLKSIELLKALKAPKTCETCKYFDDEERGNGIGTCENKKPQSPWGTVSSFGCIYHEPKVL